MIDALLIFAVFCACLGAFSREDERVRCNVTALALLASLALTSALVWLSIPFDTTDCKLIDVLVVSAIAVGAVVRGRLLWPDTLVVVLFVPVWALYDTPIAYDAITIIISVQLLLTAPAGPFFRRLVARWKANFQHRNEWTDLERAQKG